MSIEGSYKKLAAANLKRVEQYVKRIEELLRRATGRFVSLSSALDYDKSGGQFYFEDYPEVKKEVERIVSNLASGMEQTIITGTSAEWTKGTEDANGILDYVMKQVGLKSEEDLSDEVIGKYLNNHASALKAFQQRKIGGMSLSSKVWNLAESNKIEAELARSIAEGTSADAIAESMKELLNDKGNLFRRVRDEFGDLHLSKHAAAYHPGAGVYRSSFQNARRLARTEINMAYRNAEQESYMEKDYVVGIEIKRSNNWYDCPVCESLKGKYPKDFKWSGWHPNCRCYMVPILISDEEMDQWEDSIINGGEFDASLSENFVGGIPANFEEWIEANRERAKGWSSLPYFIQENVGYIGGVEYGTYSPAEMKFTRSTYAQQSMQKALGKFLQERYYDIPNTEVAAIYHYTRGDISAFRKLNKQLRSGFVSPFNQAFSELLSDGLSKVPVYEGQVHRVVVLNKTTLKKWIDASEQSGRIVFSGFASTSMSSQVVDEFARKLNLHSNESRCFLTIASKKGRNISEISQFNGRFTYQNQMEVLFDKGSLFRFTKEVEVVGDSFYFTLEEV